jgi:hypothetical protein
LDAARNKVKDILREECYLKRMKEEVQLKMSAPFNVNAEDFNSRQTAAFENYVDLSGGIYT